MGAFPDGASHYGLLDLSGNVWEWTRSLWGKDFRKPDFKYPYQPGEKYENLKAERNVLRVLRGGAFNDVFVDARCAYRGWNPLTTGTGTSGFELWWLVSPVLRNRFLWSLVYRQSR